MSTAAMIAADSPTLNLWPVRERITVDADVYSRGRGPRFICAARTARTALRAVVRSVHDPK